MYIDTHAHLFYPNYTDDVDEVIERAKQSGIDYIIVPGTDLASSANAIALAERYDFIYAAVGIHPQDSKECNSSQMLEVEKLASHKKVVAIGEIGLDYYYDFSPKEKQIKVFEEQIKLAIKLELPIIVHNRDADEDLMRIIRPYQGSGLKAQFHCFAGTIEDARELVEMHYYISFAGNITFKKADTLRNILNSIQIDNLLLETDSPFMTPFPHRGQRNEPAYINLVAKKMAEVHNLTIDDIAKATSLNAFKLFGIGAMPGLTYTYKIKNSLYINVSNRCNADCVFCKRKEDPTVKGYNLKMSKSQEPEAKTYIKEIDDPTKFDEIVFCGYGEPTIRWEVVKEVAKYVKSKGGTTRLDTDGHGNVINKRDITPEFKGLIDVVSISLNSVDKDQYAKLMKVDPQMHQEMINFAKNVKQFCSVVMTVVDYTSVDIESARKFVEEEIGVTFRERPYFS
ncbi:MAG: YchF/TatD family DNA exonuclease [Ignavibacteriales bacterium]|nr:YchF/TatD family DNA exonuclease [Ignavibacteriales bacterium]